MARHVVAAQILVGLVHNKGAARLQPWLPYERACWRQQEKLCPQACMPADSCVSMGKALLPNCSFLTVETGITTSTSAVQGNCLSPLGRTGRKMPCRFDQFLCMLPTGPPRDSPEVLREETAQRKGNGRGSAAKVEHLLGAS